MGISHSVLEPEPSGLGHVDSNELLKPILTCAPPSCCCILPLKSLCLGLQQEFLSQRSRKEEKVSTELSKESTRAIHSSSHTCHFSPPVPTCWSQPGCCEQQRRKSSGSCSSWKVPSPPLMCSSVQPTLPNQIPLFPHPNPRTSCSAADSRH